MKHILVFDILKEEMGIDVSCVREVLKPQEIHTLPKAPEFIEGVIDLREHIIGVIDLRKKFGIKAAAENRPDARIIICRIKRFIVGLIVDRVSELISLSEQNIKSTTEIFSTQIEDDYVAGIARYKDRVITLLDLEKVLTKKEVEIFADTQTASSKKPKSPREK